MKIRDWLNSGLLIFGLLIVAVLVARSRLNCEIPGSSWVPCIWGEPLKRYQRAMTDLRFHRRGPWRKSQPDLLCGTLMGNRWHMFITERPIPMLIWRRC